MKEPGRVIIRDYTPSDARGVAELFNESEEGWPGGLTGGVEVTEESVRERISRSKHVAVLLAEDVEKGKIVGFLSMSEHWLGRDACYVALLNVHPAYRGRGIGTRLLRKALQRARELGYDRVDLHTWAGNVRALRLYKKLGFKWVPGTGVYMQNYLPGLLKLRPFAKLLEKGEEAVYSFRKRLEPQEDDERFDGREVFVYEWELDGEKVAAVIDRRAWAPCRIECGEYRVELSVDEDRPVRGLPFTALLELENRTGKPLEYSIEVSASEDVEVEPLTQLYGVVEPGGAATAKFSVRVAPQAKDKPDDEPSRRVEALVKLGGEKLKLAAGFKDVPPLALEVAVPRLLPVGYRGPLKLSLRNKSRRTVKVVFESKRVKPRSVEVEPNGSRVVELFDLEPSEDGRPIEVAYSLEAESGLVSGYSLKVAVPRVEPGRVAYLVDEERDAIVVSSPSYVATVLLRGGRVEVDDVEGRPLVYFGTEAVGPPFWPNELERKVFKHRVYRLGDAVKVELSAVVDKLGGAELVKLLTFRPGAPHLEVEYRLGGSSSAEAELRVSPRLAGLSRRTYIPAGEGLLVVEFTPGETFASAQDAPREPSEIREGWALHLAAKPVAFMWPLESLVKLDFSWGKLPELRYRLEAGRESCKLGPFRLLIGEGEWRTLRRLYHLWYTGVHRLSPVREVEDVEVSTSPPLPLVEAGGLSDVTVIVRRRRRKRLKGRLVLESERVEPRELEVELVRVEAVKRAVKVATEKRGMLVVPYTLFSNYGVRRGELAVAAVKAGGEVVVEVNGREAVVSNGYLQFRVSASYAGALFSLSVNGVENAYTPYPEVGSLEWFNPWYGGVRPCFSLGRDSLWREKWSLREATVGEWRGVEVEATVRHEVNDRLRGLKIVQQYLTLPGSNLVALRAVLENSGRGFVEPRYALSAFLKPGGELARGFRVVGSQASREWVQDEFIEEVYVVVEDGYAVLKGGWEAALVPAASSQARVFVGAMSLGPRHGCHLFLGLEEAEPLPPGGKLEVVAYLALDAEEAEKYRHLSRLAIR